MYTNKSNPSNGIVGILGIFQHQGDGHTLILRAITRQLTYLVRFEGQVM